MGYFLRIIKKSYSQIIPFLRKKYSEIRLNIKMISYEDEANQYAKKHLIPDLTSDDRKQINNYWANYGIHFNQYGWFRRYYYYTGIKDPRFIPHSILRYIIYPYYNDLYKAGIWADKNEFSRIIPDMKFPDTIAQCIHGIIYDSERNYLGKSIQNSIIEKIYDYCISNNLDSIIFKKTTATNSGRGVKKIPVSSKKDVSLLLKEVGNQDWIIQESIKQHSFFAQFNNSSVNIIRINTWRNGDDVIIFSPCVRFGTEGSVTDVSYVEGKEIISAVGINNSGKLFDYYMTNHGEKATLNIKNNQVPLWNEICDQVKKSHKMLDYFDVVAWDITVDINNTIICLEYNIQEPGSIVYQYIHGPFLGEYTDSFLSFLRDSANQRRLIPNCIRIKNQK